MRIQLPVSSVPAGGRVQLFVLEPQHVTDTYVSWLNDPSVNRFLESRYERHTVETTRQFVERTTESADNLFLGIISQPSGRHVGNIKIGPINRRHQTAEIGILIGDRTEWGTGIATAAIRIMSEIARDALGLRKVTAGCYASNVGSRRAFEKAGYVVEAIRPAQLLLDGIPEDLVLMGQCLT